MSVDQFEEAKEANQKQKYSNKQTERNLALRREIKGHPTISRNAGVTTPTLSLKLWL